MHRSRQRAKRLIGADIRGGLFAPDVLLARGQRQDESAPALRVRRLSRKTPGHLPHEFLARRDHADERAAVTRRQAKALAFHRHDVRFGRWPHEAERNTLRDRHHEERARRVRASASPANGSIAPKKIRRLHDNGGDIIPQGGSSAFASSVPCAANGISSTLQARIRAYVFSTSRYSGCRDRATSTR